MSCRRLENGKEGCWEGIQLDQGGEVINCSFERNITSPAFSGSFLRTDHEFLTILHLRFTPRLFAFHNL